MVWNDVICCGNHFKFYLVIILRFLQDRDRLLILSPDFAVGNELVMMRGTPLLAVTKIKYADSEKVMFKF